MSIILCEWYGFLLVSSVDSRGEKWQWSGRVAEAVWTVEDIPPSSIQFIVSSLA